MWYLFAGARGGSGRLDVGNVVVVHDGEADDDARVQQGDEHARLLQQPEAQHGRGLLAGGVLGARAQQVLRVGRLDQVGEEQLGAL